MVWDALSNIKHLDEVLDIDQGEKGIFVFCENMDQVFQLIKFSNEYFHI